jgi:hypothetical protein
MRLIDIRGSSRCDFIVRLSGMLSGFRVARTRGDIQAAAISSAVVRATKRFASSREATSVWSSPHFHHRNAFGHQHGGGSHGEIVGLPDSQGTGVGAIDHALRPFEDSDSHFFSVARTPPVR